MSSTERPSLNLKPHLRYWTLCARILPEPYQSADSTLLSLRFFIIAALDLLGALDTFTPIQKQAWIDAIYEHQLPSGAGFRGSHSTNLGTYRNLWNVEWDQGSLPNTFLGVLSLVILGDDLRQLRRKELLAWIGTLQRSDGGFGECLASKHDLGLSGEGEVPVGGGDVRCVLCACGLAYLLCVDEEDVPFDEEAVRRYVGRCQGWDGGWGEGVAREGHSGLGYCAVASLGCLARLRKEEGGLEEWIDVEKAMEWCLKRQTTWIEEDESDEEDDGNITNMNGHAHKQTTGDADGTEQQPQSEPPPIIAGFNGRPNKVADTCYAFWNCGALAVLERQELTNIQPLRRYLLDKTQHMIGGFGKDPGGKPDALHSYLGLATLSLYGEPGLKDFDSVLCCGSHVKDKIDAIKRRWKNEERS